MKKRVYKIKDKILVQGDENLLTEDEVLVKEENGSVVLKERVNGEVKSIVVNREEVTNIGVINLSESETSSKTVSQYVYDITAEEYEKLKNADIPLVFSDGDEFNYFKILYRGEFMEYNGAESTIIVGIFHGQEGTFEFDFPISGNIGKTSERYILQINK